MADRKTSLVSVSIFWAITAAVIVAMVLNRKRDMIDAALAMAVFFLAARQSYLYLKDRKKDIAER
jgi:uncharacterized membrane protein